MNELLRITFTKHLILLLSSNTLNNKYNHPQTQNKQKDKTISTDAFINNAQKGNKHLS